MTWGGLGRLREGAAWTILTATAREALVPCAPQVIVHEVPGQEIEVEVFDKDPDKDDFLGR